MRPVTGSEEQYDRTCFVIMPYHVREVGARRVDFDRVYETVLRPAIRRVRVDGQVMIPVRADEAQQSRVLILSMVQVLLRARLAIAEVSTPNENVFWELGMRHNAVRSGTVLVRLKGTRSLPFDIATVAAKEYAHTPPQAAAESVAAIAAVLRESLKRNEVDSPRFLAAQQFAAALGTPEAPTALGEAVADAEMRVLAGTPKDAASLYSRAVALAPDQPLLLHRRGTLFLQAGEPELARRSFLEVLAKDPANGDARRMLAGIRQGVRPALIAPDPFQSPLLEDLVMRDGTLEPALMQASSAPKAMDISIVPGTRERGAYHSTVRIIAAPSHSVLPVRDLLGQYGFSPLVSVDLPEANRTIYGFDVTSRSKAEQTSTIGGLTEGLSGIPGVGKVKVGGGFGRGGGGGGFGGL